MISNPENLPTLIFSLVRKAFSYQSGALAFLAAAPAWSFKQFFEMVLRGTDMRDLVIPLTLFGVLLMMYILVSFADFYTGISASKKEHLISTGSPRGYIKSDKLWSSIWKSLGVLLIATIITLFTLIFAIMQMDTFYNIFLVGLVFFYIVVMLFDLHSIGENQLRRFNEKPKFYVFLDDASKAIREGIIKKISNLFN